MKQSTVRLAWPWSSQSAPLRNNLLAGLKAKYNNQLDDCGHYTDDDDESNQLINQSICNNLIMQKSKMAVTPTPVVAPTGVVQRFEFEPQAQTGATSGHTHCMKHDAPKEPSASQD